MSVGVEESFEFRDRLGPDFGVVFRGVPEFEEPLGVLSCGFGERLDDDILEGFGPVSSTRFERLPAPDTEVPVTRCLLTASRTLARSGRVGFVVLDVESVNPGEFPVCVLREDGDVPAGDLRPADPPVMILDVCLVHPTARKMGRAGLAEIREGDRLRDARTFGRLFEHLRYHPVAHRLGLRELRPEGRGPVVRCRMVAEPPLDVRDRGDERDCPLALLAVDSDLKTVLVVGDVPDSEVLKLPTPKTGIELERDSGVIAGVARAEGFLAL